MHPYLTADIPGTGGVIKESPEDFIVTEIPAYEPCGSGEHLYLTFEKRGITTLEAIRRIAGGLKVSERDVGYAGMKDAVGVTRQTISLQGTRSEEALSLQLDGITICSAIRHTNKLKPGHLKGNRFQITVRGAVPGASAAAILAVLKRRGVPNWFGYQRYGAQGNSHLIGAAMLRRDWHKAVDCVIGEPGAVRDAEWRSAIVAYQQGDLAGALQRMPRHCRSERDVLQRLAARPEAWEKAFAAIHPRLKKLYLSAFQSYLFDKVVEARLAVIDQVRVGDLAWKHLNGACFLVEDAEKEQPRADRFDISPTGILFGSRVSWASGEPGQIEEAVIAEAGTTKDTLVASAKACGFRGERRALRIPLTELEWSLSGDVLTLSFSLPPGAYATSVLRELMKVSPMNP